MPRPEPTREVLLDRCIDQLLAGEPWQGALPAESRARTEITGLMDVAERLHNLAGHTTGLERPRKEHLWRRIATARRGLVRRIALHRLPYLPPLWIRPEAC
jgi:hypothetical protein